MYPIRELKKLLISFFNKVNIALCAGVFEERTNVFKLHGKNLCNYSVINEMLFIGCFDLVSGKI